MGDIFALLVVITLATGAVMAVIAFYWVLAALIAVFVLAVAPFFLYGFAKGFAAEQRKQRSESGERSNRSPRP